MVTQDGRHRGHHLGEPNHELDLAGAATCDVTFGPDALALRRIEGGGDENQSSIYLFSNGRQSRGRPALAYRILEVLLQTGAVLGLTVVRQS